MGIVIPFERMKDVTGWTLTRIGEYVKENGWKGFILHWKEGNEVTIERTT